MNATDSTKPDENTQYIDALKKWNAITEKFDVAFDKKRLSNSAAQAMKCLAASVKTIAEYREVCRVIAHHRPIAEDDFKQIVDALNISFGTSKPQIKADIKDHEKERNASKKKMKQESNMDVHGIQRSVQWVAMGGKENLTKLDTITNTKALIDAMGITVRHNIMTRMDEYSGGVAEGRDQGSAIIRIISAGKSLEYGCRDVGDHLEEIARENEYHPVRDWLDGVEWDGTSRLKALGDTLVSDMDDAFKLTLIKRWAVGAIRAAMDETPPALQGVLVLSGDQGMGKTTWLKSLCPLPGAVLDGVELDPHNTDSVRKATSAWITELGELDGTMRKEIAALKAFITSDKDLYRTPYAKVARPYLRRTAYTGSVNKDEYLLDPTGNRRWLTIKVDSIAYHNIDMQQFWAEMRDLAEDGESHSLNRDELAMINNHNKAFEHVDMYDELVLTWYGHANDCVGRPLTPLTATEIAESLSMTKSIDSRATAAVGAALKKCGYIRKSTRTSGGTPLKRYMMPAKLHRG